MKGNILRWAGGLAGIPLAAAAYRRLTSDAAAAQRPERRFRITATVEPNLVIDLVDLTRRVNGRAVQAGADSFYVPIPGGVAEETACSELRALLERYEQRYPGIRVRIVAEPATNGRSRWFGRTGRPSKT
jgi:hypothetical protein